MDKPIPNFIPVGEFCGGQPTLLCPICGDYYIHPVCLECWPPGAPKGRLQVDSEGIHLSPSERPPGRGVLITLKFGCEQGHAFTYEMQFCKGQTYVNRSSECVEPSDWTTIWRN